MYNTTGSKNTNSTLKKKCYLSNFKAVVNMRRSKEVGGLKLNIKCGKNMLYLVSFIKIRSTKC